MGLAPALLLALSVCSLPSALAGGKAPTARVEAAEVRSVLTGEFGFGRPAGLAYSLEKNLLLVGKATAKRTRVLRLAQLETSRGAFSLPKLSRPSTLSYDARGGGLFGISGNQLVSVRSSALTAGKPAVTKTDLALRLRNPQGAAFDPVTRTWLVLDSGARALLSVSRTGQAGKSSAGISVRRLGDQTLRGLAFNPVDRLLYTAGVDQGLVFGLDRAGKVRKTYSIRSAAMRNLTGLVFAPSSDTKDSAGVQHLYAADAGGPSMLGRVVEFSLSPGPSLPRTVTATLAQTIDTGKLQSPSPDPAGIAYLPAGDELIISDSEIEEIPAYQGANLFTLKRNGALLATGTTLPANREPTGLGFDPRTATLYVSDDNKRVVNMHVPGPDGRHGTPDDSVSVMSTVPFGSRDPEGVEIDPSSGHLFVADGIGIQVFDIDPVNGAFGDGDDVVRRFDVGRYGVRDAEGIGYDPRADTLLVADYKTRRIFEVTKDGALKRIITLLAISPRISPASVTVAPSSGQTTGGALSYWVTDRGLDNNRHPGETDGRIYEVRLP